MARGNPSLGKTAATGILFDPEIRSAVAHAVPPLTRLAFAVGKRMMREQARQMGLAASPPRRRLGPAVGGLALVAVAVVLATDENRRRKLQRLIVH